MIRAAGLTVRIGSATLLDDVGLSAEPGELVAVIGPNGAGKSTLLRVLSGDLTPTAGAVYLGNEAVRAIDIPSRAMRRSVLIRGSETAVPFTVWEVAMMGRHPHRRDPDNSNAADAAAVEAALARMDVASLSHRIHGTLSGGERSRVDLARVLAQAAPLLLLDEPTTALDVRHEVSVMRELRAEAEAGRTVIAVLHDLNGAARYATRILAIAGGRLVADGAPADVFSDALLTEIYGHPMRVLPHPLDDGVLVLPE